jgi:hypothetical protein
MKEEIREAEEIPMTEEMIEEAPAKNVMNVKNVRKETSREVEIE